jgi:hypothetical protein
MLKPIGKSIWMFFVICNSITNGSTEVIKKTSVSQSCNKIEIELRWLTRHKNLAY